MRTIEDYLRGQAAAYGGRALIVGKGPSFAELQPDRLRDHFIVGLNEVALQLRCNAAFIIDEDILLANGDALLANVSDALITPNIMHAKRLSVGGLTLYGPVSNQDPDAAWRRTAAAVHRRFNLATADADPALGAVYPAYNFSAPTLANLLAASGFTRIGLAGIDGGSHYSGEFERFEFKKLKSVQSSFDAQFADLRQVRERWGVEFFSVRCSEAHILIGAEPEQTLAEEVLKWSIDTNTFLKVNYCKPPSDSRDLYAEGAAGTPFSMQRLYLPRMARGRGRGVYFDSDMLVFKDVYEVFNAPMGEHVLLNCVPTLGRRLQYSVFVVDNERATWDPEDVLRQYRAGTLSYESIMRDFCFASPKAARLPHYWNSLEAFEPGTTANIHYTDMGTQPWLSVYNPNASLWCEALFTSLEARPAVRRALEVSLANGWVRPSLAWQVEHRAADPWRLPRSVKKLDDDWLPPHARLRSGQAPRSLELLKWSLASRLRRTMQSRSYGRLVKLIHALRKAF